MSSHRWLWSLGVLVILTIAVIWIAQLSTNSSVPSTKSIATSSHSITPKIVPGGLGILSSFYRAEQVQGTYLETQAGSVVLNIPSYLTDPSLDYPYRFGVSNSNNEEIPYVTYPSVVRAVGGWAPQFASSTDSNPDGSDPIRYDSASGQWVIDYSQITKGIQILLNAGYTPSDITISLDNIPWDLSTQKCDNGACTLATQKGYCATSSKGSLSQG